MDDNFDLDDLPIMAANDAAKKWGITDSRIRQKILDFPKGTAKKYGKQWIVTERGMNAVFGKRNDEGVDNDELPKSK